MRKVLRALGHVTREGVIALKGRAACELNTADELVVGELLMEGVFQDLDAAVAVALLSCLCHTEKAKEGAPPLRGALQAAYEQLRAAATTVARACVAAGLPVDEVEYVDRFNPDLMEVLFQWTNGAKFVDLTKLTDAFEGTIIRVIRRLDELLRQLASAAFAVGNFELKAKFDAGATRAITQFFFDPQCFFDFRDRAAAAGIDGEIVPGIMPVLSFAAVQRMSGLCGTAIPDWMEGLFDGLDDRPEARQLVSATIAAELCRRLYAGGVRQFHFYTLNRAELSYAICHMLGLRPKVAA